MSIEVSCPGGHTIRVKDKYAGKKGKCPHCDAVVQVPDPKVSDPPLPAPCDSNDDDTALVHDEDVSVQDSSGLSLIGTSSILAKSNVMLCPKCNRKVRVPKNKVCPNCGAYYTYWA